MLVHCFRMLALLSCFCALPAVAQVQVLTAKRIHTGNPEQPVATAMAWDNEGRVLDVGEAKAILANHPGAQHIEAGDATVIPGLIDAHGHLMGLGYALMLADLTGTTLYTVSRTLSQWEAEGILQSRRRHLVIRSPHRLAALADLK